MQWIFDVVLIGMLGATLFHAVRLERALGALKRDRAALENLVSSFNASTRQAEQGIERLRTASDGAGRQLAKQIDTATTLKDDLTYLAERGAKLADRLDAAVRNGRQAPADLPRPPAPDFAGIASDAEAELPRLRSQAERDLFKALRLAR